MLGSRRRLSQLAPILNPIQSMRRLPFTVHRSTFTVQRSNEDSLRIHARPPTNHERISEIRRHVPTPDPRRFILKTPDARCRMPDLCNICLHARTRDAWMRGRMDGWTSRYAVRC